MNDYEPRRPPTDLPPRIEAVCVQFEDRLRNGEGVRMEDVLHGVDKAERESYLRLLLPIEWEHRRRLGERVDLEPYLARFPDEQSLVRSVFHEESHWSNAGDELRQALEHETSDGDSLSRLDSDHGRFLPGSKIAGRYRIVSLLGKGGMGEVYRADDLRLGQAVALKFLPRSLARDSDRIARFRTEVRLARQISHPNVCRVYDMDEVDGEYLLSMEFVDGEDLSALLQRIGQLPEPKAIQVAQQLCAGVAAAHSKGVLHRDLKPANIMIDGRGLVRITDFGLAKLASDPQTREIAGTPAYMAPEQRSLGQATIQSDLYSLGLILLEVFAGEAASDNDLLAAESTGLAAEIDEPVASVIRHCLQSDPTDRPNSALEVADGLPGGSPLSAAIAGGETPPPQMVAAAGSVGHATKRFGGITLAFICVGLLLVAWLSNRTNIVNRIVMDKHPRVLVTDANRIIRSLGYDEPAVDTAWEFAVDYHCLYYVRNHVDQISQGEDRLSGQPPAVFFWYRHSPVPLEPERFYGAWTFRRLAGVLIDDPPNRKVGMITMRLDPQGHLVQFQATPPQRDLRSSTDESTDWPERLKSDAESIFGFDLSDFRQTTPQWTPPTVCDTRQAWLGSYPNGIPIRVEAAGYRGKPVYVHVIGDWTPADREPMAAMPQGIAALRPAFWILTIGVSVFLAGRNFRTGRGDRHGACRFAFFFLVCDMLVWLLADSHVPSVVGEYKQFFASLSWSVLNAAEYGLIYFAIEPYARRYCPRTMISWSRLLAGKLGDPLVGRHILLGVAAGVALKLVLQLSVLNDGLSEQWGSTASCLPALMGTQRSVLEMIMMFTNATWIGLRTLMMFLMCLTIVRNQRMAVGAFVVFSLAMYGDVVGRPPQSTIFIAVYWLLSAVLLVRIGLLPLIVGTTVGSFLLQWPITTNASAWYFGHGLSAVLVVVLAAVFGLYSTTREIPTVRMS